MIGCVIWTREEPYPPRRIGKCAFYQGNPVYVFNQPTLYRRLQAYGVAETVLVEMIREDVRQIHYLVGAETYIADRDQVIAEGIRETGAGRRGYVYWPLKRWRVMDTTIPYPWVSETNIVTLPWRVDAPELADWKARVLAAQPRPPLQLSLLPA
jgi:hypothetical protein